MKSQTGELKRTLRLVRRYTPAVALAISFGLGAIEAADWPQWRGPNRDARVPSGAPVPTALPAEPRVLWKQPAGTGHSSPIIAGDRLLYSDAEDGAETIHAADARTGKELWKTSYAKVYEDEWGAGPRSTPFVDGDRVYVQSVDGEFSCLNLASGKILWRTNFADFGIAFIGYKGNWGTASRRGNNGNGIIDGDQVVVPVGSTNGACLVAFDKMTGREKWRALNDEAAYSSLVLAVLAGTPQIVAFTADALVGVDRKNGALLWRVPLETNAKRHAATPVIMGDRVVVNSHTIGMVCYEIKRTDQGFTAERAWANTALKINIATPVLVEGHLYCQGANKDYVCVDAANGKLKWSQPGFGSGRKDYSSTLVLGKNLLVLTEDGQLILLASDPAQYRELGRVQVCGNTWAFPAYAAGKLYVRDGRSLACVDLLGR